MCVIVYEPKGVQLDRTLLKKCYEANQDGSGLMYVKDKKLVVEKGFFSFAAYWKRRKAVKTAVISHFRIATHGKVSKNTCHPYWVKSGRLAVAHNGTLSKHTPKNKEGYESDTQLFIKQVLSKLPPNFLDYGAIHTLIEDTIGTSKLAFMDKHGDVAIMNESLGEWKDKAWFSNMRWDIKPVVQVTTVIPTNTVSNSACKHYNTSQIPWSKQPSECDECIECGGLLLTPEDKLIGICPNCLDLANKIKGY